MKGPKKKKTLPLSVVVVPAWVFCYHPKTSDDRLLLGNCDWCVSRLPAFVLVNAGTHSGISCKQKKTGKRLEGWNQWHGKDSASALAINVPLLKPRETQMSHTVKGRVGGGDGRRSKMFRRSESASRSCLRGCWTPPASTHTFRSRTTPARFSNLPGTVWLSSSSILPGRTQAPPKGGGGLETLALGGLTSNQKPAFLHFFNHKNEKLNTFIADGRATNVD